MFEIGKPYRLNIGFGDNVTHALYKVLEFDPPLLKAEAESGVIFIFNTQSYGFISATLQSSAHPPEIHIADLSKI